MLEIRQINENEKLTASTRLEIVCTSRDLCLLKASIFMAIFNLESENIDNFKKELESLKMDIINFQYPD